jgi:hypothetical protein
MTGKIQVALANHFILRVYGHIWKRDGKPFPLHTILLMFEDPTLLTPSKQGMK